MPRNMPMPRRSSVIPYATADVLAPSIPASRSTVGFSERAFDEDGMPADSDSVQSNGGRSSARPARTDSAPYAGRWRVFWVLAGANFIAAMDTTFSNIALPTIADEFGLSLAAAAWIPLAGALTISGMLLPMGKLADLTGRKRMQLAGIAMLCGGSILAWAAPNVPVLIASRMISSMGVAIVFTQMLSICAAVFPENERSRSLGGAMAASTTGMIVGPLVGGYVIDAFGWRAAYVVMAVLAVPCYVSSHVVLLESRIGLKQPPARISFDWVGSLLAAGGICLGIFALNEGSRAGWDSPLILTTAGLSVVSLAVFVWWELRCDDPLFDLGHFRNRVFALAMVARGIGFVGVSAMFFIVPFLVQDVQGRSSGDIGLVFFAAAVAAAAGATFLGGLFDRSRVRFAVLGLFLGVVSSIMFAVFSGGASVGADRPGWRGDRSGDGDMGNSHIGHHVVGGGRRFLQFGCGVFERGQEHVPGGGYRCGHGHRHRGDVDTRRVRRPGGYFGRCQRRNCRGIRFRSAARIHHGRGDVRCGHDRRRVPVGKGRGVSETGR